MSTTMLGLAGFGGLILLLFIRVPIGAALGSVAIVGLSSMFGLQRALAVVGNTTFDFLANWSLTAIPAFILMGTLAVHAGITTRLYHAARVWLAFLPGGLAIATNVASAGFAAASGSSMAMASMMGKLAVPEMLKYGYDKGLASGIVAASGTLGALIPPSIPFILFGAFMEVSIGRLLLAGLLPGLLTFLLYSVLIYARVKRNPALAPAVREIVPRAQKTRVALATWPLIIIVAIVIGGLYSGIVTASEVGAFGALAIVAISVILGTFSWKALWASLKETAEISATLLFIAAGAVIFSKFLTIAGIPDLLGSFVGIHVSLTLFIAITFVAYLILGMFLDPIGLMLVTLPVLTPALIALHVDLIWFGVLIVKLIEIGMLTPPVGLNLFATSASVGDKIDFNTIVRGTAWFLIPEAFVMMLLVMFPSISLIIPNSMFH